jgi:signal transduction histidine kinase
VTDRGASAPSTPPPGRGSAKPPKAKRSSRFAIRNWRVRSKLLALIVIPTLAALLLAGMRVTSSIGIASDYQQINETAVLVSKLAELAHELELERDLTTRFVANDRRDASAMEAQHTAVSNLQNEVRSDVEALARSERPERAEAQQIGNRLDELPQLRKAAAESQLDSRSVALLYQHVINDMLFLNDDVSQGAVDEELDNSVAIFTALSRAKESVSFERATLSAGLAARRLTPTQLDDLLASRARRDSELAAYSANATLAQRELYGDTVTGQNVDRAESIRARALVLIGEGRLLTQRALGEGNTGDTWFESVSQTIELMRKVESTVADSIILRSRTLQEEEQRSALIVAGLILLLLILVLAVTTFMARSLVRPLRRLRGEALNIAGERLPERVRHMRESGDKVDIGVDPIGVDTLDEVGEVARAFDEIHREAIRLAGEEARLRSNVNAMFVNLSRRSQTLVERQITLIDGLEQGEQDESRLANLFKLDHLATRMRRNSENLLVLAGQEPPRRWSQPVKLVDVARASLSEVENYERVVLQVPDGVSVAGQAVNDVIHLIAELVENALSFSPRETRVTVSGSRIDGGGVMLSITDSGIGMTQEELASANERLLDAPTVDVSVSRRMGLFVVARLAHRHDIRVQLRTHGAGGLTAMVLLPDALLGAQATPFAGAGAGAGTGTGPMGAPTREPFGAQIPREDPPSFGTPVPPPPQQWGAAPGSGHPSFPSQPVPDSGWSAAMPAWPSDVAGWPGESRDSGPDTSDVWVPSRNSGGSWNSEPPPLPKRQPSPPSEEVSTWSFNNRDQTPPGRDADPPAQSRYDFPETEAAATGPIPAVPQGDEYLPIFASVESAWFDHNDNAADVNWGNSKADAGWTAAEAAREPVRDAPTSAGLPKRVPRANLVPGSAATPSAAPKEAAPARSPVSPDRIRSRLSSFQQGFRAARDDLSEGRAYPPGSKNVESREEGE